MHDAVVDLRKLLEADLRSAASTDILIDQPLASNIRWSPHLHDRSSGTAWHVLTEVEDSQRWVERMRDAAAKSNSLRLGVCAPAQVVTDETVLQVIDEMEASVAIIDVDDEDNAIGVRRSDLVADMIYQEQLTLSRETARVILDRWLVRCAEATTNERKGVTLEVLTAVMLSQVSGYAVRSRGVSNRSQQIDVMVHNRRLGGILGGSPLVIAEAKNWKHPPPGTNEYYSIRRKIETRSGRSRLGFFVTTDHFTRGVYDERLRDSTREILIVPLDKDSLPAIWRTGKSITENLEEAALDAASI